MKMKRKDVDNAIITAQKKLKKKYACKSRGGILYKIIDDYFITFLISYSTEHEYDTLYIRADIKPYFIDDIFWEVFEIPENANEPVGLRANGAFVIYGCKFYKTEIKITSIDEVENIVDKLLEEACQRADEVVEELGDDVHNFLEFASGIEFRGAYDHELTIMLYDITDGKYEEAKKRAEYNIANHNRGYYGTGKKNIYEFVVDYCNERL